MTLTDMWTSSQEQLADKKIDQVIKFAGDGRLNDGNDTSHEFRDFLSHVPSHLLRLYAAECLAEKGSVRTQGSTPISARDGAGNCSTSNLRAGAGKAGADAF